MKNRQSGKVLKNLFITLLVLSLLGAGGFVGWKRLQVSVKVDPPQLVSVKKDEFVHEILERGNVDSASNIEVRCQVESAGGLTIISVVPEGTVVKKDDLLVELDSSSLRENVTKQRIAVAASQSKLAQSKADLETARLTLEEYLQGKFKEEEQQILNDRYTADEEVKTAEENVSFSKKLLERGYITDTVYDADNIVLQQARNKQQIAKLKLKVLLEFTKKKTVVQHEASIKTNEAKVESDTESLQLDNDRLLHLETQLKRCRITAPQDGQVVYYMPRWGGDEDLIKEGKKVVERQILLRLPDPSQMQVKGLVNEANIRLVKLGQTATIRLEAFPNQVFNGVVKQVNDYPEPGNWMGGSMSKEYMTTVLILDAPEGIKPGLTAEVRITVNRIADALILPGQAVFEYGGKTYSITYHDGKWAKVEVKTGPTNDKNVVVLEGLKEGDQVVLGAWAHRDKVDLPKLQPEDEKRNGNGNSNGNGEMKGPGTDKSGMETKPAEGEQAPKADRPEGGRRPEGERGPRRERSQENPDNKDKPAGEPKPDKSAELKPAESKSVESKPTGP